MYMCADLYLHFYIHAFMTFMTASDEKFVFAFAHSSSSCRSRYSKVKKHPKNRKSLRRLQQPWNTLSGSFIAHGSVFLTLVLHFDIRNHFQNAPLQCQTACRAPTLEDTFMPTKSINSMLLPSRLPKALVPTLNEFPVSKFQSRKTLRNLLRLPARRHCPE